MPSWCVVVVVAAASAGAVAAEPQEATPAPSPKVRIGFGASAGLEISPGAVVLLEPAIGFPVGARMTWYVRPAWSLGAARMGGGSSSLTYGIKEVRTGPTWWMCGASACSGVSADLGLQYLRSHERGGDGEVPIDETRRDYMLVGDVRLRGMTPSRGRLSLEVSLGLRLKRTLYSTGQVEKQQNGGGGLLLGFAVFARF